MMRDTLPPDFEERAAAFKAATLRRRTARANARTAWAIAGMPDEISFAIKRAFASKSRGKGFPDFRRRRPAGKEKIAASVRYACTACSEAGLTLTSFDQLAEQPAVDAIIRKFDQGDWSGQSVGSVLADLRAVCRALFGQTPPVLKVRTSHWVQSRRSLPRRQLSATEYLEGAVGIAALADFVAAAGQDRRAQAMRGDAALLAAASELHGRRGEYEMSDVLMTKRSSAPHGTITFYWDAELRKNKKTRLAEVRQPRAITLLDMAIAGRTEGPVFLSSFSGKGLTGEAIYKALGRATLLASGFRACPNSLRDAGANRSTDPRQMGRAVGSSAAVAAKHYRDSMADTGRSLIAQALCRAARQ